MLCGTRLSSAVLYATGLRKTSPWYAMVCITIEHCTLFLFNHVYFKSIKIEGPKRPLTMHWFTLLNLAGLDGAMLNSAIRLQYFAGRCLAEQRFTVLHLAVVRFAEFYYIGPCLITSPSYPSLSFILKWRLLP